MQATKHVKLIAKYLGLYANFRSGPRDFHTGMFLFFALIRNTALLCDFEVEDLGTDLDAILLDLGPTTYDACRDCLLTFTARTDEITGAVSTADLDAWFESILANLSKKTLAEMTAAWYWTICELLSFFGPKVRYDLSQREFLASLARYLYESQGGPNAFFVATYS